MNPAGVNPAGEAEILALDGAASISLVGAHMSMTIQQKPASEEYDNVCMISMITVLADVEP